MPLELLELLELLEELEELDEDEVDEFDEFDELEELEPELEELGRSDTPPQATNITLKMKHETLVRIELTSTVLKIRISSPSNAFYLFVSMKAIALGHSC